MKIFKHRVNTLAELRETPQQFGCEIDIRSERSNLILHHDAFVAGELFVDWLSEYAHSGLILNVKEAGLEDAIRDLLKQHSVEEYFFLDQAFPYILWDSRIGKTESAIRFSEFESMQSIRLMKGLADWVWIDSFQPFSHSAQDLHEIASLGFKMCIVSPELQHRDSPNEIDVIKAVLRELPIPIEAVCTKHPSHWMKEGMGF